MRKALDWTIKIGGLIITGPVTWFVAGQLYSDIGSIAVRTIVQVAAVALVEGVFLANWIALELDKQAAPEIKARYGLTALALYFGLWALAWQHGEGLAGIVFRAALGAALIGSGWNTYVETWQKLTSKADRSIEATARYRRENRKMALAEAIHKRRQQSMVTLAQIDAETSGQLRAVELYAKRLVDSVRVEDKAARVVIDAKARELSDSTMANGFPYPIDKAREQKQLQAAYTDEQLREQIAAAFANDPKYTRVQLAEELNIGTTKLYSVIGDMVETGLLEKLDGGEYRVQVGMNGNGNGHH